MGVTPLAGENHILYLFLNQEIKLICIIIEEYLFKIIELNFDNGCYPTSWSKSYTILIFKSGDKTDLHNYRGISLQNCRAKLLIVGATPLAGANHILY